MRRLRTTGWLCSVAPASSQQQAGTNLTGGTDVSSTNLDVTSFLDKIEAVKFNTLCFPVGKGEGDTLHTAAKAKIKYMRENMGKGVQVVMPDATTPDYEGVINVTNAVVVDGKSLTNAQACAWVAGVTAAASCTKSNTYTVYEGATDIVGAKSNEEAIAAINAGELFFSFSEEGKVVVEYDINSLTTFNKPKDKTYRKNRVIRVFDAFAEAVQLNFPPNKYDNGPTGWEVMKRASADDHPIPRTFWRTWGAIKNVDYDNDFLIDASLSSGDETYFNVGLEAVDAAEKLYFTIKTR